MQDNSESEPECEHSVHFAPNSRDRMFFTKNHGAGLWDMGIDTVEKLPREIDHATVASFSPDGQLISLVSALEEQVVIWDMTRRCFIKQKYITLGDTCLVDVALSKSGKYIAVYGFFCDVDDHVITVWDFDATGSQSTGLKVLEFPQSGTLMGALHVSDQDQYLIVNAKSLCQNS